MRADKRKYIFVTGGVVSSLGKGIAAASIGALLENRGLKVSMLKLDPYINVDPGTMSPYQHGEVYVTEDGGETDLDLGHYERYTQATMTRRNNYTAGRIYQQVINKERRGEYLGQTVQVIPHVTDEIKNVIMQAGEDADLVITEVGGTVGDIESLPFLEAIRQMKFQVGAHNTLYVHLTLIPYIAAAGEMKTKPTQHSVQKLREIGIQPDMLLCRTQKPLSREMRDKIALFCNVSLDCVVEARDVDCIYEMPVLLHQQGFDDKVAELLNIWSRAPALDRWEEIARKFRNPKGEVEIGIVGKYTELRESYKSLNEALAHGGLANETKVSFRFLDSQQLETEGTKLLEGVHGVLVPGGFGSRGTQGKIEAVRWARESKTPYFGICLGMQMAVIEYARNLCGLAGANSAEFDEKTPHPVIALMETQKAVTDKGGTMRLGSYPCVLKRGTLAREVYGTGEITERHRHRFELNNAYRDQLAAKGLVLSGVAPDESLVEMVELQDHPWFIGCQFHPEFKSKPYRAHPLFRAFIAAAMKQRDQAR